MVSSVGRVLGKFAALLALLIAPTLLFGAAQPQEKESPAELQAIILCYHVVHSPTDTVYSLPREVFREQMQYLATTGYNVIPLADLIDYVEGRRDSLPPNPVVITIDDGWRCTYTEFYPELKKLGFPFTVFIYPKFISRGKNPYALSWAEVKEMADDGVDIQSHSFSHPFLTHRRHPSLSHSEYTSWLYSELQRSKEAIERETGKPVRFLAYPYGDYDTRVAKAAEAAGYDGALTCDYGPVRKGMNPFRLRRISIYKDTSFAMFREHLATAGSGKLKLDEITPPPGEVFDPKHPIIEARIDNFEQLDPESVGMSVLSLGKAPYYFNQEDGSVSLVIREPLSADEHRVVVWATERGTGRRVEASWKFYVKEDEAPAATVRQRKPVERPVAAARAAESRQGGQRR